MDGRGRLAEPLTRPGNMRGRRGAGACLRPGQRVLAPVLAKMASRISRFMRFWALRLEGVRIPRFTGIAASALFLVASIGYGAVRGDHVRMIVDTLEDWRDAGANSLGFRIAAVSLSGEKHVSRAEIVAAAGVTGRTSLLFLDVEAARARLKTMPWIAEATVRKLFPDRRQTRPRYAARARSRQAAHQPRHPGDRPALAGSGHGPLVGCGRAGARGGAQAAEEEGRRRMS